MNFKSHSQAGQDAFVHAILNGKTDGFYVDIGCSHPTEWSNSFGLECFGWKGVALDGDSRCVDLHAAFRKNPARCGDATTFDWKAELADYPAVLDYASVDTDEHTHKSLLRLLQSGKRFRIISCEHDFYQRGDRLRIPNRTILLNLGYDLLCADVHSNKCQFEDWFVSPDLVDMSIAERFHSTGLEWQDVLRQGGVL